MTDAVWLGIIVAAGSITTTVVTRWAAVKDRKIQYEREDLLEKRAQEVAKGTREVAAQAAEAAKLLLEHDEQAARVAKQAAEIVNGKLHELSQGQDRIHVLVNSNLEEALKAQSVALKGWLASLISVGEDQALIQELKRRVQTLDVILADRAKATNIANAEVTKTNVIGD